MTIQSSLAALSSNPCKKWIKLIKKTKDQRKVNEVIEVEYKDDKPGIYNRLHYARDSQPFANLHF
jgi:hypothetical protein